MGDDVWFRSISENTKTVGDPEPLYGPPTALGNTLDFNPNNYDFVASSNTALVDTTDGALSGNDRSQTRAYFRCHWFA